MSDQWDHLELTPEQVDGLPAHLWSRCDDCGDDLDPGTAQLIFRGQENAPVIHCPDCGDD